ncbi:type III secretion system inner rod subunit SctI [Caenimonas koreensis]|uniref:EscI/YscI/HrpB family type III secretion system inner rod protein n=1 Tax=Caenimonas koreensis DSM 17982 TaxID=1121255 RepID=A0A844B610_9BURK|nr:type III secretion system inner rod subunit SctI [Caenimonas koreensis]MRD47089.1 EscI/YscI/HrpB family type III secretion system inner rod protein [Caenimonas koreensis DSM 17982]
MSVEAISVVAQATAQSSWVDTPVLRSVSESDAARMSDLLSAKGMQAQSGTPPVVNIPQNGNTIGDSILRSFDAAGKDYKVKTHEIDRLLNLDANKITTTELLKMQMRLIETSMQVDLISKTVSKAVQHIDQLTKLQ